MERVTEQKGNKFVHHLERYKFATKFVNKKVVYSVACGTGYGESYLAKEGGAEFVLGVDKSQEAIDYATSKYHLNNLNFLCGEVSDLPDNSADVFVSFETIEHIKDDNNFLVNIKRVLKSGGILILSTPNKASSIRNLFARKPIHSN